MQQKNTANTANLQLLKKASTDLTTYLTLPDSVIQQFIDHKLTEMKLANTRRLTIDFRNPMNEDIDKYVDSSSPAIRASFMSIDQHRYVLQDSYEWLHTYYNNHGFTDDVIIDKLIEQTYSYIKSNTDLCIAKYYNLHRYYHNHYNIIIDNHIGVLLKSKQYLKQLNIKYKQYFLTKNVKLTIIIWYRYIY